MKKNTSQSIKKLYDYLYEKEYTRRAWAREKWGHIDGKMFKLGRALVPLISLFGLLLTLLICMIRRLNIPSVQRAITGSDATLSTVVKDDPLIYPFFIFTALISCFLIFTAIRFLIGKYKSSPLFLCISSSILFICMLLRYFADQGTFPDNKNYETPSPFNYYELCLFAAAAFAILIIYSIILLIIITKDNKEFQRNAEHTLLKIIPKEKENALLSESDYEKYIDEYIAREKEKEEIGKLSKQEAKRRKKNKS